MQYFKIALRAGEPFNHHVGGRFFLIDEIIGATAVNVVLVRNGTDLVVPNRRVLFKAITTFESLILTSAIDCIVAFFVSFEDVDNGGQDEQRVSVPGGVKITNTVAERVPVDIGGATVNVTATNVGINNADANPVPVRQKAGDVWTVEQATEVDTRAYLAAAVANIAPFAAGAVAAEFLAASAARRGYRIKNTGLNPVAIGGAGIVFAAAAVLIQPGETWNENEAPGAAWYCICDTGLTSTLNVQTIT